MIDKLSSRKNVIRNYPNRSKPRNPKDKLLKPKKKNSKKSMTKR